MAAAENTVSLSSKGARRRKISSFKVGLVVIFACLAAVIWVSSRRGAAHELVESIDNRIADLMFKIRGPVPTTGRVVIADIDEKSLGELGQWPWPRDRVAQLLRKLAADGAKVIGLDIVFAESDRQSPIHSLSRIEALTGTKLELPEGVGDNDLVLAEAIADTPTVLGYLFLMSPDGLAQPGDARPFPAYTCEISEGIELQALRANGVPEAYRPVMNTAKITSGGGLSEGYFNTFLDVAGMVRRVPLFTLFGTPVDVGSEARDWGLYPSLGLEMLREGLGETTAAPVIYKRGIKEVVVGERVLPTDADGQMCLNFRGPQRTIPYYSIVDILEDRLPGDTFRDKYVLVGASAAGLMDLRSTPLDTAFPGVEVHASMLDNALAGDPMRHDLLTQKGVTTVVIVVGGLILSAVLAFFGPGAGTIAGLLILLVVCVGDYHVFFLDNQLVGPTYSFASLLVVFISMTLANYFLEGREKRVIRGMFATMVSGDVLKYMENNPQSFSLAGEERHATMFFSDVAGFTTISESLSPPNLVALLNAYLTPMTEIIMDLNGYVDKYEGDAIMAEWGVPFPSDDHARLGCFAAIAQQARLAEMREDLYQRFGHRLHVRMGLNSGRVSAGNMGSTRRFSYTVMGDAVNQAARFEPANKDYGTDIMMGATTYELARDHIEARLLDLIVVKGKTEPIKIYELIARKGEITPAHAEAVALYEAALQTHWQRDFEGAMAKLRRCLEIRPEDGPAQALLKRIEGYLTTPPPAAWQGEYVRAGKD